MRHAGYQLSFHFDVQGVIFRVCSITPHPNPSLSLHISLLPLTISHAVFISRSGGTGGGVPEGGRALIHVCQLPQ